MQPEVSISKNFYVNSAHGEVSWNQAFKMVIISLMLLSSTFFYFNFIAGKLICIIRLF